MESGPTTRERKIEFGFGIGVGDEHQCEAKERDLRPRSPCDEVQRPSIKREIILPHCRTDFDVFSHLH